MNCEKKREEDYIGRKGEMGVMVEGMRVRGRWMERVKEHLREDLRGAMGMQID